MAEPLIPTGFWSYTRVDDEASGKRLAQLSDALIAELQVQIGGPHRVHIFRDFSDIPLGSTWEQELSAALDRSSFLIPIVTPSFLHSEWCRKELLRFRQREIALGRNDLIFAVRYIDARHVTRGWPEAEDGGELTAMLDARQALDFTALRHADPKSEPVARQVERLAVQIRNALARDPPRMAATGSAGVAGLGSEGAAPASTVLGSEPAEGPTTGTSTTPSAPTMPERMNGSVPPVDSARTFGGTIAQAAPGAGAGTDNATTMGGRQTRWRSLAGWSNAAISKGIAAVLAVVVVGGVWWGSKLTSTPPVPAPQPSPSPPQRVPSVPAPVALPVPPPPPQPRRVERTPPPTPTPSADVNRAIEQGGREGRIQIVLAWDDANDLDLAVVCPNNQVIFFNNRRACGGKLDLDRNILAADPPPAENIVFPDDPVAGTYRILVKNNNQRVPGGQASPFRVTVRQEGVPDRVLTGEAPFNQELSVGEFRVPECNQETKSGGRGTTTTRHYLSPQPGLVTLSWDMRRFPDRLRVMHKGRQIAGSKGYVSGQDSVTFDWNPPSGGTGDDYTVTIIVDADPSGNNTEWSYSLGCPTGQRR